jgi:hypothetical protein
MLYCSVKILPFCRSAAVQPCEEEKNKKYSFQADACEEEADGTTVVIRRMKEKTILWSIDY